MIASLRGRPAWRRVSLWLEAKTCRWKVTEATSVPELVRIRMGEPAEQAGTPL
jgi:hypothetical protein